MQFKIIRGEFQAVLVLVVLSLAVGDLVKGSFLGQPRLVRAPDTPSKYLSPAQARKLEESLDDLAEVSVDEDDVDSILVPRIRGVRQTPAVVEATNEEGEAGQVPSGAEQVREPLPHSNIHRQIPNLVKMLSTLNFTDADLLQSNTVRAGFDPITSYNVFQPMWDSSLNSLQQFVDASAELAALYHDIQVLSVENVGIMKDMVAGTHTNYVGYYN